MADETVHADTEDDGMQAAVDEAKRTIQQFLDAFADPQPGQESFLVKVVFVESGQFEHVWVVDLDFSAQPLRGRVATEPALPGLELGQLVEFAAPQISDWMYIENGRLVGGFTTRVFRDRLNPEQRAAFDKAAPYEF
jgi:uncharacterized protein YegJ (DUF2314 family)